MYIDQPDDNDTAHVSDLKEVNNSSCQRLNQKVGNIEKCRGSCHSPTFFQTLSEYLKCGCLRLQRCSSSPSVAATRGRLTRAHLGGGDHVVN